MRRLRIMHSEAATSLGGQERRILNEMLAMRERGHELEAILQPEAVLAEKLRQAGFRLHLMPMDGPLNFLKAVNATRRILRQGRFDVLNTHSRRDTLIAGLGGRMAATPLIVRTRHLSHRPGSLLSYTKIPHRVTTVSEYVRQGLIQRGVAPEHVATVYSPINLPPPGQHSTLRQELGLSSQDVIIGCVAVMRRPKGHCDLVDALIPIMAARPHVQAVFVGGGSPVFEEVQAYVTSKGLADRIHLLGMRSDVAQLLAGFDIFALATHHEASGTVFVEAAAAGLPVVGTRVGGVAETIQDGVTGMLVPPRAPEAMSRALLTLVDDAPKRRAMGEAGAQWVRASQRFDITGLVQTTEACYLRWLTERAS